MSQEERVITRLHNEPPSDAQILAEEMMRRHDFVLQQYEHFIEKAETMPEVVDDDDTAGKVSDYIKNLQACQKTLDAVRADEKAPHLAKGRAVDMFFNSRIDKIKAVKDKISDPLARYLKKKEDEKRRAAEEKARIEREAAETARKAAEEKARLAQEAAEKAQREKDEAERKAAEEKAEAEREKERMRKEAEEKAENLRKKAEAEAAAAKAEIDRLEREKAEAEEKRKNEILQEEAAKQEADEKHQAELSAALKRAEDAEKARKAAEKEAKTVLKDVERDVKEIDKNVRESEKTVEASTKAAEKEVKALNRESLSAQDEANRQDRYASKAERATDEKSAILSRTRGDESMASVTETWIGSIVSREALWADAEKIWQHIPFEALEQAVNSYVRAGGRNLAGAIIEKEMKAVVRG